MGELHLEIYVERMKREYGVQLNVGKPRVNYRETITKRARFEYLHKKQTGGAGQFAKVCGWLEPIDESEGKLFEFIDATIGGSIPPEFIPAVEKGFMECLEQVSFIKHVFPTSYQILITRSVTVKIGPTLRFPR